MATPLVTRIFFIVFFLSKSASLQKYKSFREENPKPVYSHIISLIYNHDLWLYIYVHKYV